MIEELAEECHPRIERRRQADIRGRVRNEEDLSVVVGAEDAVETRTHNRSREGIFRGSRDRSRIVFRLVDDQIGDGSWLGIDYGAGISIVRVRAKQRIRQPWERVVRSAELVLTRNQVVDSPVTVLNPNGTSAFGRMSTSSSPAAFLSAIWI